MSPFELPGPQFLVLYSGIALFGMAFVLAFRIMCEPKDPPVRPLSEPYPIAYLRGGPKEVVRVAIATLVQRDWMEVSGPDVITKGGASAFAEEPLEKHLLEYARGSTPTPLYMLLRSETLDVARACYEPNLVTQRLLPSLNENAARLASRAFVAFVLISLAGVKISVALSHGKKNVLFLGMLCLLFCGGLFFVSPRRTPAGTTALDDLRTLFARLKTRTSRTTQLRNSDFAFLVSIFGLDAASGPQHSFIGAIQRAREPQNQNSSSCSSSNSSCSSSSSSSCGGSCGGGGCGGCGG